MNEYWARELLKKNNLDYNKFYKKHLETFLDISRKDNKNLKEENNRLNNIINEYENDIKILMNIISKNDIEITPEEDEVLEKYE